jgi:hypothetical protein
MLVVWSAFLTVACSEFLLAEKLVVWLVGETAAYAVAWMVFYWVVQLVVELVS